MRYDPFKPNRAGMPFPNMIKHDLGGVLGTNASAPPPRNQAREFQQTANAFMQSAPAFFNLASVYTEPYNQINIDSMYRNMVGYDVPAAAAGAPGSTTAVPGTGVIPGGTTTPVSDVLSGRQGKRGRGNLVPAQPTVLPVGANSQLTPGHHPGLLEMASLQRGSDIGDVMSLGPAAFAALLRANPMLASSLVNLEGRLSDSPILQKLNSDALDSLNSGGFLTPEQQRQVNQASRTTYAARGLALSDPAIASEILNRDNAVQSRLAASRQFATGVEGLNENQAGIVGNAARTFSSVFDPYQAVLSRPTSVPQIPQTTAQPSFSPTNQYSQDLYNTNYNAQAAANISSANNNAALWGALIKSAGQVAGAAAMSDRRAKKYVKRIGKSPSGLGIYKFQYKGKLKTPTYIGPMAQDVERKNPDAVTTGRGGMKMVKLDKIDVPFHEIGKLLAA